MKRIAVIALLSLSSAAYAQVPSPTQVGIAKSGSPYPVFVMLNSSWYQIGSITPSGVWSANAPSATARGGVYSKTASSSQWLRSLGDDGTFASSQPTGFDVIFQPLGGVARNVNDALLDWGVASNSFSSVALSSTAAGANPVHFANSTTLASGISTPNSQWWYGLGAGTVLTYSGTTGSMITSYGNGSGVRLMAIKQGGTPSSTTGITIGTGEQGQQPVIQDVSINGFNVGIDGYSNLLRKLTNVKIDGMPVGGTGIRWRNPISPDSGDDTWSGVTIDGSSPIAKELVKYESAGGLKVFGFKGLGSENGFHVSIPDGVATQDFQMVGSSIENSTVACMTFERSGTTGTFGNVTITGNEFAGCPIGMWFKNAGVPNAAVVGNIFSSTSTAPIQIENGANNILVGYNRYNGSTSVLDNRNDFNEGAFIDRTDVRSVNNANSSVWSNIWKIDVTNYRSARVSIFIEGIVQDVGYFAVNKEVILSNPGGGGNVVVTSINSTTAGTTVGFNIDVSTTPGSAYIQYRLGASGTQMQGTATMHADGKVKLVTRQ